jgi:thiamine biosynthesis lipoprotein
VDAAGSTIRKLQPAVAADLSALAKGYAVDQVAELLRVERIESYLIEVGGEVRTRGHSERGDPWRAGIERPSPGPPALQRRFGLRDLALATSGDYRNFFEVDGRRLSHTIDPRTGRPVMHGLASASVIDPLCVRADALATALEVLGPEDGFTHAARHGWAALLIGRQPDGTLYERETPAFAALTTAS